jgi:ABC-type uncharacterized transport system ATPase subunit
VLQRAVDGADQAAAARAEGPHALRGGIAIVLEGFEREVAQVVGSHGLSSTDRVLGLSQRATVMNQGEVLMSGTPDDVRADRRVQEV